ncbi:MAG: hypothetical protein K8S62_13155 [Candidatus Sabulitectum sp.]|nr:hypothetical protein [Candidatus Sabulitectum sp.]
MEKFIENMCNTVLPGCFNLKVLSFDFGNKNDFLVTVNDSRNFLSFIQEKWDFLCEGCYSDVFHSGFLGSYAFALWFMEFDEDNWFSYDSVHKETEKYLNSYSSVSDRNELRIIKGSFLPMKLDLPVVVDYEKLSVTVWTGELRD